MSEQDAYRETLRAFARLKGVTEEEAAAPDLCEQCREAPATVYAMDPFPGGWGGRYCEPCARALGFSITDRLETPFPVEYTQGTPERREAG